MFDDPNSPLVPLAPQRMVRCIGNFFEQRKAYRLANLLSLRKREGLPGPVDDQGNPLETRMDDSGDAAYYNAAGEKVTRVLFAGAGRDGKPGSFATGTRKQSSEIVIDEHGIARQVPTSSVSAAWASGHSAFEILEVAEDGRKLQDELADLDRDAQGMSVAEKVSHGREGEQAPELVLNGTSDEEVDQRLQEYLKRGKQ